MMAKVALCALFLVAVTLAAEENHGVVMMEEAMPTDVAKVNRILVYCRCVGVSMAPICSYSEIKR